MKKFTLLLALAAGWYANAQDVIEIPESLIVDRRHEVKLGVVKALAGGIVEGTYEYIKTPEFTFGASVLGNFDADNDYQQDFAATLFTRFYFENYMLHSATGFFVEGFGEYYTGHRYNSEINEFFEVSEEKVNYSAAALGICLGKKWVSKSGFVFEILAGAGRTLGGDSNTPDAVFRGDLNLGYRF